MLKIPRLEDCPDWASYRATVEGTLLILRDYFPLMWHAVETLSDDVINKLSHNDTMYIIYAVRKLAREIGIEF